MIGGDHTLPWRGSTPAKDYEKGMLPNERIDPTPRLHSADSTGTNVKQDPSGMTDYPGIRVVAAILSRKPEHFVHLRQRSSASST